MSSVVQLKIAQPPSKYDFEAQLRRNGIDLPPLSIDTLQVNVTKLCNQVCRHCHVDASPNRKEMMSPQGMAKCLEILERNPQISGSTSRAARPNCIRVLTASSRRPSGSAGT